MKVSMVSDMERAAPTPHEQRQTYVKSCFLDTGGSADSACLTMCRTDIPGRIIYVTGAMYWKLSEEERILFATIRNDIAKLHLINRFGLMGCETNNYGRSEMESLRREYGIAMHGINTTGRVTSEKTVKKGESMDKEAIIRFANAWRTNVIADPGNEHRLGQIKFLRDKTADLKKLVFELENFIRKVPEGLGTGRPRFGAEGRGHDDGPMSMLGHFFMIKTRVFRIYSGHGAVGAARHDGSHMAEASPPGRSTAHVPRTDSVI